MAPFIFGEKNGIYIIDLQKTVNYIAKAAEFLNGLVAKGDYILFVGTKLQAREIIEEQASRCAMFYVNHRWLGGTLTNFQTVTRSVAHLKDLRKMKEDGEFDSLSKKMVSSLSRELLKLEKNLSGIIEMNRLPGALFVIDPNKEKLAVKEAKKLNIPVVALIDTNGDPSDIDYPVPGNDDAIKAIKLITTLIAETVIDGRQGFIKGEEEKPEAESPQRRATGEQKPETKKPKPKKGKKQEVAVPVEENTEQNAEEKIEEKIEEKTADVVVDEPGPSNKEEPQV